MKTILVVDDDFAMRRGIGLTLKGAGYTVFEAQDATTALELLRENRIDLAVVDLFLPGCDGLQLAGEIKKASPLTKIMMVTAHNGHARANKARHQFGDNFLDKSRLSRLLIEKAERLLKVSNN